MPRNSGKNSGQLVKQAHGGALLSGGVAGHKGGSGRPPSMVRAALLQKGWDAVPEIEGIMNGESSTGQPVHPSQQISAWKTMMELSLPKINETLTVTIDSERIIRALSTVFNRHFTREKSLELIKELRAEVEGK